MKSANSQEFLTVVSGRLKKVGKICGYTYKMLISSDCLCPRFYGLPIIHKPGIPSMPIVSFFNSPTYAVFGYLERILSLVVGNTDYSVKNSCELAEFKRDKTHNVCEQLVSFKSWWWRLTSWRPFTPRQKKVQLISKRIKRALVAAFRSPLMEALDSSVETLGRRVVSSRLLSLNLSTRGASNHV